MDANSTISCNWLSATDVVRDIQAFELNVTDIVTQCADICQIVFQSNSLVSTGPSIDCQANDATRILLNKECVLTSILEE